LIIGDILSLRGTCIASERAAFTYPSITTVDVEFSALTLRFLACLIDSFPLRIKGATRSFGSGRANAPSSSAGNDVLALFCHHALRSIWIGNVVGIFVGRTGYKNNSAGPRLQRTRKVGLVDEFEDRGRHRHVCRADRIILRDVAVVPEHRIV
jgi:hypothetical protein